MYLQLCSTSSFSKKWLVWVGVLLVGALFLGCITPPGNYNYEQQAIAEPSNQEQEVAVPDADGICRSKVVDLGLSVKWGGWNVGASVPEEYGGLYGWADPTGANTSKNNSDYPSKKPPKNISGTQYDIARAKWGGGWRLPTLSEIRELKAQCKWTWITYKGIKGYKVTGPNGNSIFLPAAGYRGGAEVDRRGAYGGYWSGTLYDGSGDAGCLSFSSGGVGWYGDYRYYGLSVRPVTD